MASKTNNGKANGKVDVAVLDTQPVFHVDSLAPLMQELERAANWFTAYHGLQFGAQRHTVVVNTGQKQAKCYGWFKGQAREIDENKVETGNVVYPWNIREVDGTTHGVTELMISGEHLNREPLDILATVFHEIVHAYANAHNLQDCAKSGRHNKKFSELCDKVGMDCTEDDKGSWRVTSMRDALRQAVESDFQPRMEVFNMAASAYKPKGKTESKLRKYVCNCETGVERKGSEYRSYNAVVLNGQCYDCKSDFREVARASK